MEENEHVHECEYERHRGKEDLGCICACGAIHHLANWQTPKVLDQ